MKEGNMEPEEGWEELGEHQYKVYEFFEKMHNDFKFVDLINQNVAIAKYGGPIAVSRKLENIYICHIANDPLKDNICFYSNSGQLITKIPMKEQIPIVAFDFIEDELLLVLLENGRYYLVDPFKRDHLRMYELGDKQFKDKDDKIVKGKVFNNGLVFQTRNNQFHYVLNLYEPHINNFKKTNFNQILRNWVVIPPNYSITKKIELQVTHPQDGIIQIIEDEAFKVYYQETDSITAKQFNLPKIPNIELIAISPGYQFIAYLSRTKGDQWSVYVLSADFEGSTNFFTPLNQEFSTVSQEFQACLNKDEIQNLSEEEKQQALQKVVPYNMTWCGEDCIVIVVQQMIFLVSPLKSAKIKTNPKGAFCCSEIDGLRFITNDKNRILRLIPIAYRNLFQSLSTEPAALLYMAYDSYEKKQPLEAEDIRNDKHALIEAVQDCIEAGSFELNSDYQQIILQAAVYGKTYLKDKFPNQQLLEQVCKYLRVINDLKRLIPRRTLTYAQITNLSQQNLINLLLRYNLHYQALEICKYLNFDQKLKIKICIHWAQCKVEANKDDNDICEEIQNQLQNEKGISFTEIAHKAIEVGKPDLALKLLDSEPCISKKVPVLLWMANGEGAQNYTDYFEKALLEAIRSRDSNLIHLVIMRMMNSDFEKSKIFEILNRDPLSEAHLKVYLKMFDEAQMQLYLQSTKNFYESGLLAVQQAFSTKDLAKCTFFMKTASQFFKNEGIDPQYSQLIDEEVSLMEDCLQKTKDTKLKKNFQEVSITQILETFLREDMTKEAKDLIKRVNISDKRFMMSRIKILIEKRDFEQLDQVMDDANKKKIVIPYEIVADMLLQINEEEMALQFINKMPDLEEQIQLLMRIGKAERAVDQVVKMKKFDLLQDILNQVVDEKLRAKIKQYQGAGNRR